MDKKERVAVYIDGGNTYRRLKDLGIPENAYLLSFDIKFKKEGDGDWLTTNFNNNLLFSFRGDSFFDVDEYQHIELNIRSLAGQAGMIDFTLHGFGTTTSEVLIKNILISKLHAGKFF